MRAKRLMAGLMALFLVILAGCGTKTAETPKAADPKPAEAPKKEPVEVVLWSSASEGEQAVIQKLASEWATKTGNKPVTLVNIQSGFKEAAAAISAGKGPDLYYGVPHDNLGHYHLAGFLDPVPAGLLNPADYEKLAIDAVSYDGKMFAVPWGFEAIGLLYNKALVKEAPKTWDEFVKVATEKGFAYDIKNFYFSYGFIGGSGGYVFKDKGGGLDAKDVGLANAGAKAGLKILEDFVYTHKFMKMDTNYDVMDGQFKQGKIAMVINGPWSIQSIRDAKIDVGVAPLPTLPNGKPFVPFVGVYTGLVSSSSKVKAEAWDLAKYLQDNGQPALFKAGNRFPALKKAGDSADVKNDPLSAGFGASAKNGVPMPNIPAMSAVWEPAGSMITAVVEKKATPDKAADEAVKTINEAISKLK